MAMSDRIIGAQVSFGSISDAEGTKTVVVLPGMLSGVDLDLLQKFIVDELMSKKLSAATDSRQRDPSPDGAAKRYFDFRNNLFFGSMGCCRKSEVLPDGIGEAQDILPPEKRPIARVFKSHRHVDLEGVQGNVSVELRGAALFNATLFMELSDSEARKIPVGSEILVTLEKL